MTESNHEPPMWAQPYPFLDTWFKRVAVAAGIGLYVFVFLLYLQPLGLRSIREEYKAGMMAGFALVSVVVSLGSWGLWSRLFPRYFCEENWTVGLEIAFNAWVFFGIGLANFGLAVVLNLISGSWRHYLEIQMVTVLVGITPVLGYVLASMFHLLRRHRRDIEQLNQLARQSNAGETVNSVTLVSETGKEKLTLNPTDLRCLASVENYVTVTHRVGGRIEKTLLRNTLKNLSDQLASDPNMFRCHRTYLLNLRHVVSVSGNAQGYRVQLTDVDPFIPVARSRVAAFKTALERRKKAVRP